MWYFIMACVKYGPVYTQHQNLLDQIDVSEKDEWAKTCAPEEVAMAYSHREFAENEFSQGDLHRAEDHLNRANANIAIAIEKAEACRPKDSDGDGLMDNDDGCPFEPETLNGYKDGDGCPEVDSDVDGIYDDEDQCVNEPEDLDLYMDTDGCPDIDNDSDGILDINDKCPNSAEDFDGFDDEDGCPEATADSDGDGILDDVDLCVSEPESINQYLDEDGCPDTAPTLVRITDDQIEITQKIQFARAKSTILPVSYPILDQVAQVMRDYPAIKIRVEGHTDSDGSDKYNQKLSQDRANSVRNYLTRSAGVEGSRLESKGWGENKPIQPNTTQEGKAANRRVEFHRIESK
ncbi:MAG: OmpA family protein [Myxococcota bacterium]